jgi:hypothetical protein
VGGLRELGRPTSQGHPRTIFRGALEHHNLVLAEGTMPDRSYPGVYIEEFGPAKAIAGVAAFIVGVLVGVAVSLVLDRLRRQCKQT